MKGITTEQGRQTLEKFKIEAANEVGVNLKSGYNGDLTSREAGSVGGQMVKKMIDAYKTGSAKQQPDNNSPKFKTSGCCITPLLSQQIKNPSLLTWIFCV